MRRQTGEATDQESFYRDALGFEVRKDARYEDMRCITFGPSGRPDMNIVLTPPAADQGDLCQHRESRANGTPDGFEIRTRIHR
jgi:hypothetical protein